jgi:predicted ATP-dependent endonuclease of OLD family
MKVQQLFLRNVRSIKSLDLDFRDPVTGKAMSRIVLAGANGSGKTTILDVIYSLIGAFGRDDGEEVIDWLPMMAKSKETRAQVIFSFKEKNVSVWAGHKPVVEAGILLWPATSEEKQGKADEITADKLRTELGFGAPYGNLLYFPHGRELSPVTLSQLTPEETVIFWGYKYESQSQWEGSVESFLVWQNYLDLEDRDKGIPASRFSKLIEIVNSVLDSKRISHVSKGRILIETKDGQTHELYDLSSGEKQLVLLLIEIARYVVSGSIILIDEPEISLHPAWQRGLVAALDKIIEQYDAQVILATHSLEIATSVMPEEVISLSDLDNLPRGEWKPEKEALA